MRAVVDAAAEHLSAEWVVFALVEGELPDVRPRHLVRGPSDDTPEHVRHHVDQVSGGHPDGEHDAHQARHHLHVPIRLDGRVVGGFAAWTPNEREIEDTDHSVLRILAGQTAAALQNCGAARPLRPPARPHRPPGRRPQGPQHRAAGRPGRAGRGAAARGARRRAPPHRPRAARQRHPVRAVRRDAHRAGALGDRRRPAAHPARHGQGPHPARRRAAPVGDLRAQRRARGGRGPARPCCAGCRGVHMPDELSRRGAHRREAGGAARRVRAVALPHRGRGAVQHGRARRGEPRGRAAGLLVRARCGSRSPTTASGAPRRSAAACARRAPPRPASTAGW